MKTCSLIYNPVSSGFNNYNLEKICELISKKGYNLKLMKSEYSGHVTQLVKEANKGDLTISMGGDGTVGEVLKGYQGIKQNSYYSHISTGTSNDIAPNLGLLKKDPIKSAELILNGEPCEMDLISVNENPFAYVSCFGFLTNVPYETDYELKKKYNKMGYVIRAFKHDIFKSIPDYKIKYIIDGVEKETTCVLGAVSNSKGFGGVDVYKDVKIDDGLFEVLFVKNINLKNLLKLIKEYFQNSIDLTNYSDIITCVKTDNLKIEFLDKVPAHPIDNDGDRVDFKLDNENRYLDYHYDGKIKMLLPKKDII